MSHIAAGAKRTRPWQWPGEWISDEKFRRDVAARAASGIVVLFVGYWAAVWLGYIQQPNALKSAFETTFLVTMLLAVPIVVDRYSTLKMSQKLAMKMNKWLARLVSTVKLTAFNLVVVITAYFALWAIFIGLKTLLGTDQPPR